MSGTKKVFFAKHAKSSAALVSLGIHVVIVILALSFVAVTVITKEDQAFEAKPVKRPKMQLKKLTVPVNIKKKKTQKPKLRKRIVVKPKLNQNVPDIKMPEITGVKGGMGNSAGDGLGGAGGLGFSMPEIEIFGIKGKGEKVFLILDTGNTMLVDKMGGIPAYTIIKEELIRIVEDLPPTALINVAVYDGGHTQTAFPKLVPATDPNTTQIRKWLEPLNDAAASVRSRRYGMRTLGPGGTDMREDLRIGPFAKPVKQGGSIYGDKGRGNDWYNPVMLAHQQQADTIFLLTDTWGTQKVTINTSMSTDDWIANTSDGKKWAAKVEEAKKLHQKENAERKARGETPKVIHGGRMGLISEYFPGTRQPPRPQYYYFQPKEFGKAFLDTREKYQSKTVSIRSGLGRRKKSNRDFSFNVVQFVPQGGDAGSTAENFKKLTNMCRGDYQTVTGLDEIQSYVSASNPADQAQP